MNKIFTNLFFKSNIMNNKQIFVLASRLNGEELIANIGVQTGFVPVAAFYSLENAKDLY